MGIRSSSCVAFVILLGLSTPGRAELINKLFLAEQSYLNGQLVNSSQCWIDVLPGENITGKVNVDTGNGMSSTAVAPLGYTATWGDRVAQVVQSHGSIWAGWNQYAIDIDKTAPLEPGDYHLVFSFAGRYTIAQVFSATHAGDSPNGEWYDGNDLGWDWTPEQFQEARDYGRVTGTVSYSDAPGGFMDYTAAANWIGVRVVPEPGMLAAILLTVPMLLVRRIRR